MDVVGTMWIAVRSSCWSWSVEFEWQELKRLFLKKKFEVYFLSFTFSAGSTKFEMDQSLIFAEIKQLHGQ